MRSLSTFVVLLGAACSGAPEGDPSASDTVTYWRDVKPILEARCVACHQAGEVAPFPLDTYDDAAAVSALVAYAASERSMPPWGLEPHRDYQRDPSLSDAQIDLLVAWDDGGAPEGDPADEGPPLDIVAPPTLPRVDLTLDLPEVYAPVGSPTDDYRCFVIDWPEDELTYVTGFEARPDNALLVHHMAAFLVSPDTPLGEGVFDTFSDWDEAEEGPGYTCFGGPSGSSDLQIPIQQVAQWVPGGGAVVFPDASGIAVPPGSKIVLQVHYFVGDNAGEVDASGIDLMLSDTVERNGAFAPYLDALWPLSGMDIPAGSEDVAHGIRSDPRGFLTLFMPDLDLSAGFDIHSTMLHLHRLGREGRLSRHDADGSEEILVEVKSWDFDWQIDYRYAEPVPFRPGDELELRCLFDNPTDEDVSWGEGTDEEMCVANMYITEVTGER